MSGERIRAVRERLGLSQVQFAQLLGIPHGTLRNWEIEHRGPTGAAAVLLRLLERNTEIVASLLRELPEG